MNEWYKYVTYTDMIRIWANKQSFLINKKNKNKMTGFVYNVCVKYLQQQ